MNQRELKKHCNHIISYGPTGWGLTMLRSSLKDNKSYLRELSRAIKETKAEIRAYEKAVKIAEENYNQKLIKQRNITIAFR